MNKTLFALVFAALSLLASNSHAFSNYSQLEAIDDYDQENLFINSAWGDAKTCKNTTVHGVGGQAQANCTMLGGYVATCSLMNPQTKYWVCQCTICH